MTGLAADRDEAWRQAVERGRSWHWTKYGCYPTPSTRVAEGKMSHDIEQAVPTWGDDPLSTLLSDAQYNERVTPLKMPDVYALLQRVHLTLLRVQEITDKVSDLNLLPTRLLMARTHSAWLASPAPPTNASLGRCRRRTGSSGASRRTGARCRFAPSTSCRRWSWSGCGRGRPTADAGTRRQEGRGERRAAGGDRPHRRAALGEVAVEQARATAARAAPRVRVRA